MILKSVYKLMRGKLITMKSKMLIKTTIPSFASDRSTLNRVIPIGFQHEQEMTIPAIKGRYLIYNFGLDTYNLLQQVEMDMYDINLDSHYIPKGSCDHVRSQCYVSNELSFQKGSLD